MLAVKIVRKDGSETVFEATHIDREAGGLLIQGDGDTLFYGRGGQAYSLDCESRSRAPDQLESTGAADVFIMNRHGATVATYRI